MKNLDPQPRNILARAPNWLGDNLFTFPAVQKIRKLFPEARITVCVKEGYASLWALVEEVDNVIPFDFRGGLKTLKAKRAFARKVREGGFDLVVIFPRSFESALWMRVAGVPRRWGYREDGRSLLLTHPVKPPHGYRKMHRMDYFYHLLDSQGGAEPAPPACLRISRELRNWAMDFVRSETGVTDFDRLVGLSPHSTGGFVKDWPVENMAALARTVVQEKGATVLLFGDHWEADYNRECVEEPAGAGVFNLGGKTDLKQLAAVMSLCRVYVANDSGPAHLAAALGVPLISMFGASDPEATAPRGEHVRVIFKGVPCSPCLKKECPSDFSCMTSITLEEVMALLRELWDVRVP